MVFISVKKKKKKKKKRWGKIVVLPIYKGKGVTGDCGNYRGIALLDHIAKVYERILERRLRAVIEIQLGEEQYGYRKGRSTSDPVSYTHLRAHETPEHL